MSGHIGPAVALMCMGNAATRDQAQWWANRAAARGATPAQLAEAWAEWDELTASSVQVIPARFDERYDPSPEPIDRRIS